MISNGVYGPLKTRDPPMIAGGEATGIIEDMGDDVPKDKYFKGQTVVFSAFGHGYTEYTRINYNLVIPLPKNEKPTPESMSIIVSGFTA